jgi:hypothetical protein
MSEAIPAGTTLLLKGGQALTPDTDWNDPCRADIAIAGDKIIGICPDYGLGDARNVETINARDHLVLPGFVNAHYHSHDVLAKGTLEEAPLETWRLYALPPQYPPRSVACAAFLPDCWRQNIQAGLSGSNATWRSWQPENRGRSQSWAVNQAKRSTNLRPSPGHYYPSQSGRRGLAGLRSGPFVTRLQEQPTGCL